MSFESNLGRHGILSANAAQFQNGPFDPERETRRCAEMGVLVLFTDSPAYPALLRSIPDSPEVLYVRGRCPGEGEAAVAIVGSRNPTPYGRRMARRLAREAAEAGLVTVSGLARGIDTEAHLAALDAGGRTWAVLGSGFDRVYPRENHGLAGRIVASGGALLTEVPLAGPPLPSNFPRRNRILSGLSWATVMVEGTLRSGALITARRALEQGREVFAVPGPADSPQSAGPHRLLRDGAGLVESLGDLLEATPPLLQVIARPEPAREPGRETEKVRLDADEGRVMGWIGAESVSMEALALRSGWEAGRLVRVLTEMEVRGYIDAYPGQHYAKR